VIVGSTRAKAQQKRAGRGSERDRTFAVIENDGNRGKGLFGAARASTRRAAIGWCSSSRSVAADRRCSTA
jgi:hypothetical protein